MKDIIGTVNISRHKKVSIERVSSPKDSLHYILNEDKPLQAFNVFAESNNTHKHIENNAVCKQPSIKSKNPTIFKSKDWAKYRQESFDRDDSEKQCQNLSYCRLEEPLDSFNKPFDISKLHQCIENNNNDDNNNKYEINNEATFDSFLSNDDVSEKKYERRIRTFPSCKNKDLNNNNSTKFTSDNLFRFEPGDEIRYSDPRNVNIFASILHDHLGALSNQKSKQEIFSLNKSSTYQEITNYTPKKKDTSITDVQKFRLTRSRTPDEKRLSSSSLDRIRGSTSPRTVKFKTGSGDLSDLIENKERKTSNGSDKNDSKLRSYSESFSDVLQNGWRRIASVQRQSSDAKKNQLEFVDFGSCISPDTKKFANITDKLHTWAYRTNSKKSRHRRQISLNDTFSDPKIIPQNSKRMQRKSGDLEKMSSSSEETIQKKNKDFITYDITRDREMVHDEFFENSDFFMSSNVWYYGELDIALNFKDKNEIETEDLTTEKDFVTGYLTIVLDQYQNLFYSLTYCLGNKVHSASIPHESGKYSMDFTNPEQPRFSSLKYLIAYLIEQNFLFRVPFAWLLNRLISTCDTSESSSVETDWCSDGSEIL